MGFQSLLAEDIFEALDFAMKAYHCASSCTNNDVKANSLDFLALIYGKLKQWEQMEKAYDEALILIKGNDIESTTAVIKNNMAMNYMFKGDFNKALHLAEECLQIVEASSLSDFERVILHTIGEIYNKMGDPEKAIEYLRRALMRYRGKRLVFGEIMILIELGTIEKNRDPSTALGIFIEALNLSNESEIKHNLDQIHKNLSDIYEERDDLARAFYHYKLYHSLESEKNYSSSKAEKYYTELEKARDEIKELKGIIPICAGCKKIRDDKGYWNQVEVYIREHSKVEFSHGLCPDCVEKYYGNSRWYKKSNLKKTD